MEDAATAPLAGLSDVEAAARLRRDGANELPQSQRRTVLRIAGEVLREPMFALLVGAGAIYLIVGELADALTLLVFASLSILITVVQEARSERVLEALRDLTSPRALVIREGARKRVPGREVVRGDLLVIAEGDRVAADARLLSGHDLQADESLLTGESVPVRKSAGRLDEEPARPGGDELPFVYSGTLIVRGHGVAEVYAIGAHSEIGKIGQALSAIETEPPVLRRQTERLVRIAAVAAFAVSALAVLLYGLTRGSWVEAFLAGIALSMSMLPEEFPLVLTVFMVMGAWRISQARVLTRRAAAIESLGSATVLCTDKTGTLTQNRMRVAALHASGETRDPTEEMPDKFNVLAAYAVLASAREPFDPMERALHDLVAPGAHADWTFVRAVTACGLTCWP